MPRTKQAEPQQYRVVYHSPSGLFGVAFVDAVTERGAREAFTSKHPGVIIDQCNTEADREFQPIAPITIITPEES